MEEILASIRRIIADDDATRSPPKEAAASPPPAEPARAASTMQVPPPSRPPVPPSEPKQDLDSMLAQLSVAPGGPERESSPNVLDLTEEMAADPTPSPAPGFRTIDGHSDVMFNGRPEPSVSRVVEQARRQFNNSGERPLISSSTGAAVDSAFNALAHTVLDHNARTLEDLVREMLRPLLKTWLDDNLPGMVERMVRAEIERVSRGRS
jgi:cell pole-organizing protein PopZ